MTPISRLFKIISKAGVIPVKVDYYNKEVTFRFLSVPFGCFTFGILVFMAVANFITFVLLGDELQGATRQVIKNMMENITDIICMASFFLMLQLSPIFTILVAKKCATLPKDIVLAENLRLVEKIELQKLRFLETPCSFKKGFIFRWPRYGRWFIIAIVVFTLGTAAQLFVQLGSAYEMIEIKTGDIVLQLLIHLGGFIVFVLFNLCHLYVLVWIEKLGKMCDSILEDDFKMIEDVKRYINYHQTFNNSLGSYFLLMFSYLQLSTIANLFNILSYQIGNHYVLWKSVLMSVSFAHICFYSIILMTIITLTAEKSFNQLLATKKKLLKNKKFLPVTAKTDLEVVLDDLTDLSPLSGHGFFSLTRSNLTAMLSTSITYLIILLQFRIS